MIQTNWQQEPLRAYTLFDHYQLVVNLDLRWMPSWIFESIEQYCLENHIDEHIELPISDLVDAILDLTWVFLNNLTHAGLYYHFHMDNQGYSYLVIPTHESSMISANWVEHHLQNPYGSSDSLYHELDGFVNDLAHYYGLNQVGDGRQQDLYGLIYSILDRLCHVFITQVDATIKASCHRQQALAGLDGRYSVRYFQFPVQKFRWYDSVDLGHVLISVHLERHP